MRRHLLNNILFLLPSSFVLFIFSHGFASPPDTLKFLARKDSTIVQYFYNDFEKRGTLLLHTHDTAITGFQVYNPLYKNSPFFATLGNIGAAYRPLFPSPFFSASGFDYGIHTFDNYLFSNDSVKYYRVYKTFTEVTYEQGAKREIFFHAVFSRNIYRGLNLGFNFRVMNAPGAYTRQRTNQINFTLTTQFLTKDKRYGVVANFRINQFRNNENGGIKYDSLFEQDLESNRQIIPVNLESAINRIRESGLYMKHYFNLSRHPKGTNDTTFFSRKHLEFGRITYSFEYNRQVQNYIDDKPASGFYRNILIDSTRTFDSLTITKFINQVSWSNPSFRPDKKPRMLQVAAYFKQLYAEVFLNNQKRYIIQYIPSAEISFHPFSSFTLNAYGDYVLGDYNQNDLNLRARVSQVLGREDRNLGTISLTGNYAFREPGLFYETYYGNNFKWDTSWTKQSLITAGFSYSYRDIVEAGLNFNRINHFVYLDTASLPRQLNSEFGYICAYLKGDVDIWRFKFAGQVAYQTIQGTNALRLPGFIGNLTIYFTQQLFHGAATLQPGLNFFYNTQYYGDSYMPATRSFHLQDNRQIGNYIYMDVFVNIKIQRARIFLGYSNFNSLFMANEYYTVPGYPMQDAAFRFGVAWRFHD